VGARASAAPSAPDPSTVALAEEILSDPAFQTELPSNTGVAEVLLSNSGLSAFASVLIYVLIGAFVILAAVWLVREFALGDKTGASGKRAEAEARGSPIADDLLADPERLADQGRFDEAVHALLLIAIRHLTRDLAASPSPSSTSRELRRSLPLEATERDAFGELVRQVELSLFGGRPVAPDSYRHCRHCFETLVGGATE
jgi:hypothetical protein